MIIKIVLRWLSEIINLTLFTVKILICCPEKVGEILIEILTKPMDFIVGVVQFGLDTIEFCILSVLGSKKSDELMHRLSSVLDRPLAAASNALERLSKIARGGN